MLARITQGSINFLIYSNIWVAAALSSICYSVQMITRQIDSHYVTLCFSLCLLGYNYIYWSAFFLNQQHLNNHRLQWMNDNKIPSLILSLVCMWLLLRAFINLDHSALLKILVCIILSLLYNFPLKRQIGLRWIPGLKIVVIATIWTMLSACLQQCTIFISVSIFAMILAITIPFDIRDINKDQAKLKTLPLLLGIHTSVRWAQALLLTFCIIVVFSTDAAFAIIGTLAFIIPGIFILNRLIKPVSDQYVNLIIEGLPILWLILLLLTKTQIQDLT